MSADKLVNALQRVQAKYQAEVDEWDRKELEGANGRKEHTRPMHLPELRVVTDLLAELEAGRDHTEELLEAIV